jgi:NADH dehydrogenase/NADH:ubiquinone oxidoreductase subunit G
MELTINDQVVQAREGETILECALRSGISIPHLCTHPSLPAFGACRMCLVEVAGLRGRAASCTTPAGAGMVVQTNSPQLRTLRKEILELILLEHPSACIICEEQELCEKYRPAPQKAGRTTGCHTCNNKNACELRDLCNELGVDRLPAPPFYRELSIERWDPFIDRDLNLCILCGRCVRICAKQHGNATIDFTGRGSTTRIGEAFGRTLQEAGCHFCGSCVDVCPTGSLAERYAKWHGKDDYPGFTSCSFCPEACPIAVHCDEGRAAHARSSLPANPICVLGRFSIPAFLNHPERLRTPRIRVGEVLREVSWQSALSAAREALASVRGDGFAFICDTQSTTREDRHIFETFTRETMGSGNFMAITPDETGRVSVHLPAGIRAVYTTGAYFETPPQGQLELLIVQDAHPSSLSDRADMVFPATILVEQAGTTIDNEGTVRPLFAVAPPPGEAHADWEIVNELNQQLEAAVTEYKSFGELTTALSDAPLQQVKLRTERTGQPKAVLHPDRRRLYYRGHEIASKVAGLNSLPAADPASEGSDG